MRRVLPEAIDKDVLNPLLYARMKARFGRVKISNHGIANAERQMSDILRGRACTAVDAFGESYAANCPFCNDTRLRMSVNHTYGTCGPTNDGELRISMWKCFNEECQSRKENRKQLADWLVWSNVRGIALQARRGINSPEIALGTCELPGRCLHARHLPPDHEMIQYFQTRQDGQILHSTLVDHDVHYCADAPEQFRKAIGRAIIPFYFQEKLVGWQGRYLGDLDWKTSFSPKYYNVPGLRKTLMVYSYDRAAAVPKRPYVVLVEGVTSAWAVGPNAVALMGKSMSSEQQKLLLSTWADRPIFVYLDGSAAEDAQRAIASLAPHNGPVIDVRLPPGRDPGNLDQIANLGMIRAAAHRARVTI